MSYGHCEILSSASLYKVEYLPGISLSSEV